MHQETAAKRYISSPRQENNFFLNAFKQELTEEEIRQLLRDINWKSTDRATHNAVKTLRDSCKEQTLDESFQDAIRKVTPVYICSIFELGGTTKHFVPGTLRVSGKQNSLFPVRPVIKCFMSYS